MFKKKNDSIDYGKLNEGIRIGVNILKIVLKYQDKTGYAYRAYLR